MSYIHTIRHQLAGLICGIEVYRLFEDYEHAPSGLARATPANLLIGGGSGEHAEAVVYPVKTAAWFLDTLLDDVPAEGEEVISHRGIQLATAGLTADCEQVEALFEVLDSAGDDSDVPIDFIAWGGNDWAHFVEAAERPGANTLPYDRETEPIESWVTNAIGEFVVVSLPEFVRAHLDGVALECFEQLRQIAVQAPIYRAVRAFPSGYEYEGGRGETLGDPDVRH